MNVTLAIFASAVCALSQSFEPANFNITKALLDNGVEASAIPKISDLADRSAFSGCSAACASLKLTFGSKIVAEGASGYDDFSKSYWSQQQEQVSPNCVFYPTKALDVSTMVLVSRLTKCPFAAKSGGHASFAGASNIEGGITVTFQNMKGVTFSKTKKTVDVQPGNVWKDVYTSLQSDNVAVVGGRVASVGVGGLTTGGGISFFANELGWACDNIESYEVVTASGVIVTASLSSYADLYWALRGGGNNFGLVTSFKMRTFPLGKMWGGDRVLLEPQIPAAIDAFVTLGKNSAKDTKAAQILSFAILGGEKFAFAQLEYAEPNANAPIFSEWNKISAAQDNIGIFTLAELTEKLDVVSPFGLRQSFWTQTAKLDKDLVNFILNVFYEEHEKVADIKDLLNPLSLQVITVPQMQKMRQNGGNALNLDPSQGPLLLFNPAPTWTDAADDDRVNRMIDAMFKRTAAEAEKRGLASKYIYMNYGSKYQDVIASYGSANKARLKSIARKYDPKQVFQKLQPGYFKLEGAPAKLS
ncbi:FAD binding domain-containing protein [Didymella exigua CBS 183.55]|uniref:FAD binding domain-containing protein n=1 Tax=Didymella exigua CBS 183.55 TaxID=1150837 RepID=A0A6A5RB18_9PLEO|nr:FAD binding domain-containing protein [Didymella exigua CBS 183.55]KAF1924723.1 FAD binding domain-containing protein [Didymella exigua CBS 183.55]